MNHSIRAPQRREYYDEDDYLNTSRAEVPIAKWNDVVKLLVDKSLTCPEQAEPFTKAL